MTDDSIREQFQTDSQRYGKETTIKETFSNPRHPLDEELEAALKDTEHLSEAEAFAFVWGPLGTSPVITDKQMAEQFVQQHGFESLSEFKKVAVRAREKVADAIWIYELIDAYRFPDFPEECAECGRSLGGMWVEPDDGPSPVCRNCADVDPERHFPSWDADDSR